MKNKYFVYILAIMSVLSIGISGCAGDGSDSTNNTDNETKEELIVSVGDDVLSLSTQGSNDIPSGQATEHIYETLVNLDDNQEPIPGLAKDWKQVDDKTWDFYLEEGIKFHDGEELTADVVKQNFDRLVDEDIASPRNFLIDPVDSWEVIDTYTLRINLDEPFAPLLTNLTHIGTGIMSPNIIEEDYAQMKEGGDPDNYINQHPIGTGPLEFENWTRGEKVELSRFDDYHGDLAKSEYVTLKVVNEQSSRVAELESGTSDIANYIGPSDVSRLENEEGIYVDKQPSVSLDYLGFNTKKEPFDNKKVRQAISHAIDKQTIVDGIFEGHSIQAEGPLAPTISSYDDSIQGIEYDVDEAKQLLEDAGYPDGFETSIFTDGTEERNDIAVTIQSKLKEINIDVNIEEMEWGTYLDRLNNGEHDMFLLSWSVVTADADTALFQLFHSSQEGSSGNRTFLRNDEIDELLERGRMESDLEKRDEIYSEAQNLLIDIAPMVYLTHREHLSGVRDDVKEFSVAPSAIMQLQDAYVESSGD